MSGRLSTIHDLDTPEATEENKNHYWGKDPSTLITKAIVSSENITVGRGLDIYTSSIIPALETAEHEILFVTCFWARSASLDQLHATLVKLASRARSSPHSPKLRVRLCFSSRSITQKLFHTSSPSGYTYSPAEWVSKLGLPSPSALEGLDLQVKSIFIRPFSVKHPKFIVIDRQRALLPSCNLSYESWLECCLPLKGPIVASLVQFWQQFWGNHECPPLTVSLSTESETNEGFHFAILLPSPHHRSPNFRPLTSFPPPPATPLNAFLLHSINTASKFIKILSPNVTSPPVLSALLDALRRGVDVQIITNKFMMVLEQILTAGTVTGICVWKLMRQYKRMHRQDSVSSAKIIERTILNSEEGPRSPNLGTLHVGYFVSGLFYHKSHIKCTIVDDQIVVLGSGNMDRASWYTSEELCVALEGQHLVKCIWARIMQEIEECGTQGIRWL